MVEKQIIIGMNKEILLEQICRYKELPDSYRFINLEKFGEKINLYKYQQEALQSVMTCLNIYFKQGKAELLKDIAFHKATMKLPTNSPLQKIPMAIKIVSICWNNILMLPAIAFHSTSFVTVQVFGWLQVAAKP